MGSLGYHVYRYKKPSAFDRINAMQGRHVLRDVGIVRSAGEGPQDNLTLAEIKHQTGDYLDVAVFLPRD